METGSGPRIRHGRQKQDWLQTARQSLPVAWRVARQMRPTWELSGVAELDPQFLRRHDIRGVLWDVDGTLTHYHGPDLALEVRDPVTRLLEVEGVRHAILSNCDETRFEELGRMFPAFPVLKLYESARGEIGRLRQGGRDTWYDEGGAALESVPTEEMIAVRKPSAALIAFAAARLGLPIEGIVMVGDQYWTDVAGATMAGMRSIKVPTIGGETFPPSLRAFQRVDRWMRRILA